MLLERPAETTRPRRGIPRWLWIAGICVAAVFAAGIILLATHWPFSKDAITRALQKTTSRPVQIGAFHRSYFPPGCLAEDIRVLHNSHPDGPPLITIKKLLVKGSYLGLVTSPKRLTEVKAVGMQVLIPPKGAPDGTTSKINLGGGKSGKSLVIEKIVADGALLEVLPDEAGKKPYRLAINGLIVEGAGTGDPMAYRAILTNSEPPGVIRSQGKFGPWNGDDPGATPVSGDFLYNDVKLGEFKGISGTLQAKGKFYGPLGRMRAEGSAEVANFHVEHSANSVGLAVGFHAVVNGTNGDTRLEPAEARFLRTTVDARGAIEGQHGADGKTVTLALAATEARIEDILRLFVNEKTAPMSGALNVRGKFVWPPGPAKFVEKIRMDLDFGIDRSRFRSASTQNTIDRLSKSAQGESKGESKDDPRTMLSDLRGHVAFRNGVARFSGVSFTVPGASATLRGTYGLVDHRVDLHGVLRTKGKISDATSGFKSLILKAISPFFKKRQNAKIVPFKITGTFANASVSLD